MKMNDAEIFYPKNQKEWRHWLEKNHRVKDSVWLVQHRKSSNKASITWSEAVDEALCFGWIDSKKIKIDEETTHQFFSKRKTKSTWSKINKDKVERLTGEGLMAKAGLESVEKAKQNGSWTLLDEVEKLVVPADLEHAFSLNPGSRANFYSLSKSSKKMILHWIVMAKRPETRQKRIDEVAELAAVGKKPKHVT